MKCIVCGIDRQDIRSDAKFCSPKCRVAFSRNNVVTDNSPTPVNVTDNAEITEVSPKGQIPVTPNVKEWWNSWDYKQLMYDLENLSLEELKERGYLIPAWKHAGMKRKPDMSEVIALAGGMDKKYLDF